MHNYYLSIRTSQLGTARISNFQMIKRRSLGKTKRNIIAKLHLSIE